MIRLRYTTTALLVAIASIGGACGTGVTKSRGIGDLPEIVTAMRKHPIEIDFEQRAGSSGSGPRTSMHTIVADDYRYTTTLNAQGRDVMEEVDLDDVRYVRLADPTALVASASATNPAIDALRARQWLADRRGAPSDLAPPTPPASPAAALLGPTNALGQARFLERLHELLDPAAVKSKWNPNASTYLKKNDRFAPHKEVGVRYDFLPAAFDADRVFKDGIPSDIDQLANRYFRYTALWLQHGRITRVESLVDVPPTYASGVERAVRLQARRTGQRESDVRAAVAAATTLRPMHQTWLLRRAPAGASVAAPPDAIATDLAQLVAALGGSGGGA